MSHSNKNCTWYTLEPEKRFGFAIKVQIRCYHTATLDESLGTAAHGDKFGAVQSWYYGNNNIINVFEFLETFIPTGPT